MQISFPKEHSGLLTFIANMVFNFHIISIEQTNNAKLFVFTAFFQFFFTKILTHFYHLQALCLFKSEIWEAPGLTSLYFLSFSAFAFQIISFCLRQELKRFAPINHFIRHLSQTIQ